MRTLIFSRILPILFVTLIAGQGSTEPIPDDVNCGDDYWFTITDPVNWRSEWKPDGNSLSLLFVPEVAPREFLSMKVTLDLTGGIGTEFDIKDALQRKLSLINAFGSPSEMRPFKVQHGDLPTAGASLVFDAGSTHIVAIDVRSHSGLYFIASLSKRGGEPSPTELQIFRDTIGSIDFDPLRGCSPGADGEVQAVIFSTPDPQPPAAKAPAAKADTSPGFDLSVGAAGCKILNELYVPIDCRMTDVEGQSTLLVRFGRNDKNSAQAHLDMFTQRVATPFCYEASRHPTGAPQLIFAIESEPTGFAYDCATNGRAQAASVSLPRN